MKPRSIRLAGLGLVVVAAAAVAQQLGVILPFKSYVRITTDGASRTIESNAIPEHPVGVFPNPGNPNAITPQSLRYRVPLNPIAKASITPRTLGPVGVALNGVPFEPGAAEFWRNDPRSGWQLNALSPNVRLGLDMNHAHVQPTGKYHYHGIPDLLVGQQDPSRHSALVGYAADGFPIYSRFAYSRPMDASSPIKEMRSSYRLRTGLRPPPPLGPGGRYDGTFEQDYVFVQGAGDLDPCNGRFGVTPEHPAGIYHYVITTEYPSLPKGFRGTPDPSFAARR